MMGRSKSELVTLGLWITLQLWPLWVLWWTWNLAWAVGGDLLGHVPPVQVLNRILISKEFPAFAQPTVALLGPIVVMLIAIALHRNRLGSRAMAFAGITGVGIAALLTVEPDIVNLWPYAVAPGYPLREVIMAVLPSHAYALAVGVAAVFVGVCLAIRAWPVGSKSAPSLLRGRSDNFGHADWLPMDKARKRFPGPDPTYGGLVVGEAYRVDQDRAAKRGPFDPADKASWGMGGKAPVLVDPCKSAATHALVFAGAGGFKTTGSGIPTLLTWTGAVVVLDPSREMGPMLRDYREQALGHQVVTLDPFVPGAGFNVLDWIDTTSPAAETHVDAVVGWISGEARPGEGGSSKFFGGRGRALIRCLLADLLWDPAVPADQKTLRTLRQRLVTPEDEMRELLETIHGASHSPKARDIAGTLKGAVKDTFSGIYQNADEDTAWLSTAAYAGLVSGSAFKTRDLVRGKLTVFVQIPLHVLQTTPALGRVAIGALLNAVYDADGALEGGRVLFLLDEVARLGYMNIIEVARDAGRKYGITLVLLYQSLGQLVSQWGKEGKQAWYDSSAWRLFATVQDPDTARELSAICGEYAVVSTSSGDTEGSQSRGAIGASSSSGRSENRSEMKRALIKPEELMQDTRADEAFVVMRGSPPLRCGRAIYFRRSEWANLVGKNRFHKNAAE